MSRLKRKLNIFHIINGLKFTFNTKIIKGKKSHFIKANIYTYLKTFSLLKNIILRKIDNLPKEDYIIQNSLGKFQINYHDDSLAHSSPYYEKKFHSWLSNPNKGYFVDIGANIGFYSILAANKFSYSKIICFEPNPQVYTKLQKNISLNKLDSKSILLPYALSSEKGKLQFQQFQNRTGLSGFIEDKAEIDENSKIILVNVNTLDSIFKQEHIDPKKIGFIKIDIEGFELQALKGMKNCLKQAQKDTRIFMEILTDNNTKNQTLKILKDNNFKVEKNIGRNYLFVKIKD